MKKFLGFIATLFTTGCTTVQYNGTDTFVKEVNYPEVGKVIKINYATHDNFIKIIGCPDLFP
jgi:hypothetical protein